MILMEDFYLNREIVRLKEENEFIRKERSKHPVETKIQSRYINRFFTHLIIFLFIRSKIDYH